MIVETKYNIGDKVWILDESTPVLVTITGIAVYEESEALEWQDLKGVNYYVDKYEKQKVFKEDTVFKSPEELLEYFKGLMETTNE